MKEKAKREVPPSSYINDGSHKYILKKIDKEIKEAYHCENLQCLVNYMDFVGIMEEIGYLTTSKTPEGE
jgi:hypothetical protein